MKTKATLGLTAGALAVGLLVGLVIGNDGSAPPRAEGPGPARVVEHVPVGYARTKAGAIAAAAGYSRALSQTLGKGSDARKSVVRLASVPEREDAIIGSGPAADQLSKDLQASKVSGRLGILGQRLSSFTREEAKVRLWTVSVVSQPGVQGHASWGAGEVELRWINGDWKLWSTTADDAAAGVPALVGTPSPADHFEKAASEFLWIDDVEP